MVYIITNPQKIIHLYKYQLVFPISLFFLWRISLFLFQIFLQPLYKINSESEPLYYRLFRTWAIGWDGGHYLGIASNGYLWPQQAFFPLWPLIIKLISLLGVSYNFASFVAIFLLGLSTFIFFYLLAVKLIGLRQARFALLLFASFPSTMFLHAAYSEALFLTIVLLSFLLLEKKQFFLAALLGSLATITRATGVALVTCYLFLNQKITKRLLLFYLGMVGLLIYMACLFYTYQDPFYFKKAEETWCFHNNCQWSFPTKPLMPLATLITIGWAQPSLSTQFIDWFAAVFFIVSSYYVYKYLKFNYLIYSLLVIIPRLTTGTTTGMIRYVLVAFPVFFVMPLIFRFRPLFYLICLLLFLLQLRFVALFSNGLWVA